MAARVEAVESGGGRRAGVGYRFDGHNVDAWTSLNWDVPMALQNRVLVGDSYPLKDRPGFTGELPKPFAGKVYTP